MSHLIYNFKKLIIYKKEPQVVYTPYGKGKILKQSDNGFEVQFHYGIGFIRLQDIQYI